MTSVKNQQEENFFGEENGLNLEFIKSGPESRCNFRVSG
jgi:hypothetical protein